MSEFKFSRLDFLLTCVGLLFLLLDIGLDVMTAVDFYRQREYARLGLLVLFLIVSSLLVQTYSWLWYKYDDFERSTRTEKLPGPKLLLVLHLLQLGTYLRHAGVMEVAVQRLLFFRGRGSDPGDTAVYLSHDVAMLRIVETFSESLPQLVLMVTTNIQNGHLDTLPVLKSVGSALAVSFCVTSYHRSLRNFLKDKRQQTFVASVGYFLWNLLLIASRVAALSLFASEFPCFVLAHFLCSWLLLVFCAWRAQTDFMNGDTCGEWLYRATVGLIWYFNWFNVTEGATFWRSLLYHGFIMADMGLLCGLWFWRTSPNIQHVPHVHNVTHKVPQVSHDVPQVPYVHLLTALCVLLVYTLGLLLKAGYFHCLHPNVSKDDLKGAVPDRAESEEIMLKGVESEEIMLKAAEFEGIMLMGAKTERFMLEEVESEGVVPKYSVRSVPLADETDGAVDRRAPIRRSVEEPRINKRMMKLANNFYS